MLSMTLPRRLWLAAAFVLAAALAIPMFSAPAPARAAASLPCDIYAAGGTPCEAAYSTTRALYASYDGPLYQIQRASDGTYLNIGLESAGGIVNSAPQVSFCAGTTCTITELYDQTPNGNNMPISPGTSCSGCSHGNAGPGPNGADIGAPAMALPVTVGGQPAYGVLFDNFGTGYRIENALNVPTGSQPEGIYMLTSSNLTSNQCCFDFGSAETNNSDDGNTTMNAIYYGTDCWTRNCTGPGPWAGGDLENGMYFSDTGNNPSSIPSESGTFVSAWEKNNGTTNFTLKYGNGQSGGLTEAYSGPLPSGYDPMHVQNSIELGTGGDNTGQGLGEFFEAAVVSGFPSDATENAVQASITAAGYAPASDEPFGGTAAAVPGTVQAANYDTGGFGVALPGHPAEPAGFGAQRHRRQLPLRRGEPGGHLRHPGHQRGRGLRPRLDLLRAVVQVHRQRGHRRDLHGRLAAVVTQRGDRRTAHRQFVRHQLVREHQRPRDRGVADLDHRQRDRHLAGRAADPDH